jgi:hypothetical protein
MAPNHSPDCPASRAPQAGEWRMPAAGRRRGQGNRGRSGMPQVRMVSGRPSDAVAIISYDEKPGIQAIATTAPDLPPEPGVHATFAREHEYKCYGTGQLAGRHRPRHRQGPCAGQGPPSQPRIHRIPRASRRWQTCVKLREPQVTGRRSRELEHALLHFCVRHGIIPQASDVGWTAGPESF